MAEVAMSIHDVSGTNIQGDIETSSVDGATRQIEPNPSASDQREMVRRWLYSWTKIMKVNGKRGCSVHLILFFFMIFQIAKTICITNQLNQFGRHRRYFQDLVEKRYTTIEHLLLEDWSPELETLQYPLSRGPYAIYTSQHLIEHINYAVNNYWNFENNVIGVFTIVSSLNKTDIVRICVRYFEFENGLPDNGDSQKHPDIKEACFYANMNSSSSYDIEADIRRNNISEEKAFKRFLSITLSFQLNSLRLSEDQNSGQCLHIDGNIVYSDNSTSGQALVDLETHTSQINCRSIGVDLIDVCILEDIFSVTKAVLVLSLFSLLFIIVEGCGMILFRSRCKVHCWKNRECGVRVHCHGEGLIFASCKKQMVQTDTDTYVSVGEIIMAKWGLVLQLVGDIFIIIDSASMIDEYKKPKCNLDSGESGEARLEDLDNHAILLGIGCFICWIALTRYLNFHRRFSLLFKTIRSALPSVACYVFSAAICFCGFVLCGYALFGPYHKKFQTVCFTANTLLSIINGDEIFATAINFEKDKAGKESEMSLLYTVYIWLFVFIFTVIVFNILIAIFSSTYDEIRNAYDKNHQDDPIPTVTDSNVSENHNEVSENTCKKPCFGAFECSLLWNCKKPKFCGCDCKTLPISRNSCNNDGYEQIP